ncbi:hypothetical protein RJ639_009019 [Escallonia herrerae]|uniref:Pleckstrin-like plant domain-containing protein n=1 Tax=Escallonia herrerae TaxID=1293975 RepID=A0AA88VT04_9ASTE|nr:hypothetical protein RJ639_009019 [Escallonia herrerae]
MATLFDFSSPSWPSPNSNLGFLSPHPQLEHQNLFNNLAPMPQLDCNAPAEDDDDFEPPHDYGPPLPPSPLPVNPNSNSHLSLLHLFFNKDHACFAAGTDNGFRIYDCDPYRELFRRDFDQGGGIRIVDMLFRYNILALVLIWDDPQYPPNKVMIWDDHKGECIGELTFRSEVRAVRLRRDRIMVVLEQKIFVYNFADLNLMHQIETVVLKIKKLNLLNPFGSKEESIILDQQTELYKDSEGEENITCFLIVLTTNRGIIKLDLADDYQLYKMWTTTIDNMLSLSTSITKYELQFYQH